MLYESVFHDSDNIKYIMEIIRFMYGLAPACRDGSSGSGGGIGDILFPICFPICFPISELSFIIIYDNLSSQGT